MTMPVGVVAFAEGITIPRIGFLKIMQPMGGVEVGFSSNVYHVSIPLLDDINRTSSVELGFRISAPRLIKYIILTK